VARSGSARLAPVRNTLETGAQELGRFGGKTEAELSQNVPTQRPEVFEFGVVTGGSLDGFMGAQNVDPSAEAQPRWAAEAVAGPHEAELGQRGPGAGVRAIQIDDSKPEPEAPPKPVS